jgi:cytochrome c oxidase cbb3-type subunit 3
MKKTLYLLTLVLIAKSSVAQDATGATLPATTGNIYEEILIGVFIATLLLILVVTLTLLKTVNIISNQIKNPSTYTQQQEERRSEYGESGSEKGTELSFWNKILGLRPLSEEKDMMMEHEFDGITELDNPTPAWFMWLFYSTIAFAFVYLFYYHVFNIGKLQNEEYAIEMQAATAEKTAFLSKSGNNIDENTVKLTKDAAVISAGQAIFAANCIACHGDKGQGLVGPNLTDEYWLHGGNVNSLFKTIKYGVPEKGMIAWEKTLNSKQISDVSNYILSLKDSHPSNPKAPQGVEVED